MPILFRKLLMGFILEGLTFVSNKIPVMTKIPENWITRREPNIAIGMNRSQDSIFNSNNSEVIVVDKDILFSKITQIPDTIQNAKKTWISQPYGLNRLAVRIYSFLNIFLRPSKNKPPNNISVNVTINTMDKTRVLE